MEEALKFVTGTSPRSPQPSDEFSASQNVGSNRHVLSPQMSAFTDALAERLDHIAGGAFDVSRHRFEITGNCVRDVDGVPVALRIQLDNVIAELPGESEDCILVTAHLDSTAVESHSKDKYDPEIHDAPGMDDDGSGVAAVLVLAEAMCKRLAGRKPPFTLRFALFNAEEQGLIGSQRYARALVENGTRIVGVFQLDMISYNRVEPNSFETHAGTADRDRWPHYNREVELASLKLSNRIRRISEMLKEYDLSYLEPAQVYRSPDGAAGRSDHASFQRCGYAACLTCEDFFPCPGVSEPNPNYHRETDRVANLPYVTAITRVVFGAVLGVCDPADP